jgi:hypothetical protein
MLEAKIDILKMKSDHLKERTAYYKQILDNISGAAAPINTTKGAGKHPGGPGIPKNKAKIKAEVERLIREVDDAS